MSFQSDLVALAKRTGAMATQLLETPGLSDTARAELSALLIAQANAEAYALAELSLELLETVLEVEQVLERVSVSPVGARRYLEEQETGKILQAVTTALSDPDSAGMRLERLARSEVLRAGQDGLDDTIATMEHAVGWERELEPDGCELCRWWWRDGRVWPQDYKMPTHPGCACTKRPVYDTQYAGEVEPVGLARQRWQYHKKRRERGLSYTPRPDKRKTSEE